MIHRSGLVARLTYSKSGVNRTTREKSRARIAARILRDSHQYEFGAPIRLPFGLVYPSVTPGGTYYDLQIEGVGTKTLLAELTGKYDTIGIDAVGMAVNDVIRSGASPVLISDAIHIATSDRNKIGNLIMGVRMGARLSGCVLASGETGNVQELLHDEIKRTSPPFDLIVSCLGVANKPDLISGEITAGDSIIGLRSSGIHSNGLTLARKLLLKPWGGKFDPWYSPPFVGRPIVEELLEPTTIYVSAMRELRNSSGLKAAIHITGDGFAKFHRLLRWQRKFKQSNGRIGLKFEGLRRMPAVFKLIYDTAKEYKSPIALAEMFRTFNMGYGFAVITAGKETDTILSMLNKHVRSEKIGTVSNSGQISVSSQDTQRSLML